MLTFAGLFLMKKEKESRKVKLEVLKFLFGSEFPYSKKP